ncbi:WG repeat-containing protein [Aquirufa sp. HETE-83D]|uniref:WG repeat-containing protein n=1 Tax=Aquirufa esocilacus TaxID=3096513 RepID=A0ABW6DJ83_9BACT
MFKFNRIIFISLILLVCKVYSQNIIPTINFANNGYDYVDSTSKKIISQYTYDQAFPFREGLARVSRNGYWGFINKSGEEVIGPRYVHAEDFSEGLASVSLAKIETNEDGYVFHKDEKYGMINSNGKTIIDFKYGQLYGFKDGLAIAKDLATHNWSWIDKNGNWRLPPIYNNIDDFNKLGLAKVGISNNYKSEDGSFSGNYTSYGVINKDGQFVIPAIYYNIGNITKDFIRVTKSIGEHYEDIGKSGYLNSSGQIVIPFLFDEASDFSEDLARVGVLISDEMKFGFIDKNGSFKIPATYDYSHSFSSGMAFIKKFGQFGWINKYGSLIGHKMYDIAEDFHSDYERDSNIAIVSNNGYWGVISRNGKEIIPISYDSIAKSYEGIIAIKSNKQLLFDEKGKLLDENSKLSKINKSLYSNGFTRALVGPMNSMMNSFNNGSISLVNRKFDDSEIKWLKNGNKYELIYSIDSTKLTNDVYDSLKVITSEFNAWAYGIVGYKNKQLYIIIRDINSAYNKPKSIIIPTNYSEINNLDEFSFQGSGYIRFKKNNFWGVGIIENNEVKEIIKPIYEDVGIFPSYSTKLIPIKKNGSWGFCNTKGEIEIPFQFQKVGGFSDRDLGKHCQVMMNNKWGIINNNGVMIYPNELEDVTFFAHKLCGIKKNGKWGFINTNGEIIIPTIFTKIEEHYEYRATVQLNKMKFIIDELGVWQYGHEY